MSRHAPSHAPVITQMLGPGAFWLRENAHLNVRGVHIYRLQFQTLKCVKLIWALRVNLSELGNRLGNAMKKILYPRPMVIQKGGSWKIQKLSCIHGNGSPGFACFQNLRLSQCAGNRQKQHFLHFEFVFGHLLHHYKILAPNSFKKFRNKILSPKGI